MRALTIKDTSLEVVERDTPEVGPHDVLVEVHSAGINAADLMQRDGYYPAPPGWPVDIPGMELAGVVTEVGDRVVEPLMGRRVCAIVGGGAQAEQCMVPSEHLLFLPDHVEYERAGGFPEAFTTAYDALVTQGHLKSGQRVLISGATGGVGVAAVQIAHVLGAEVVAVTRTTEHHERLQALGATHTILLDEVSARKDVDLVLELVGAANFEHAQYALSPFGRVVVIGVGVGSRVEVDLLHIMRTRATITGSTLRSRSREEKAEVARLVSETIIPRWTQGELGVPLAGVFGLFDAVAAYKFFAEPGKFGKVVLRVSD
ncbi:MAG: zinc-binding dehydrogenase [Acidimicrobiales bacterium]